MPRYATTNAEDALLNFIADNATTINAAHSKWEGVSQARRDEAAEQLLALASRLATNILFDARDAADLEASA